MPSRVPTSALADLLKDFGHCSIALFVQPKVSKPAYAFVTFDDHTDAQRALEGLQNKTMGSRKITVAEATNRKDDKETGKDESFESDKEAKPAPEEKAKPETPKKPKRQPRKKLDTSSDTVYVGGFSDTTTEEELAKLFSSDKVTIISKPPTKRRMKGKLVSLAAKKYAFVTVGDGKQQETIDKYDGYELDGAKLILKKATVAPEAAESSESSETTEDSEATEEPKANVEAVEAGTPEEAKSG